MTRPTLYNFTQRFTTVFLLFLRAKAATAFSAS